MTSVSHGQQIVGGFKRTLCEACKIIKKRSRQMSLGIRCKEGRKLLRVLPWCEDRPGAAQAT